MTVSRASILADFAASERKTRRRLLIALHPATWRARWKAWFASREVFWGLAIGRSGTTFLSHLLDSAAGARVRHEPRREDVDAYRRACASSDAAVRYLVGFALPDVYLRERSSSPEVYGEVNSYLRRHAGALREVLPEVRIFHLVRDGRDVVRSMYSRPTLTPEDEATAHLLRNADGPTGGSDGRPSRFDWLCWYWTRENAYLRRHAEWTVRFEDLLRDYDHFRARLTGPLGLRIDRPTWSAAVSRPVHATESHELPPPPEWSADRTRRFWEICGDEMERYDYT